MLLHIYQRKWLLFIVCFELFFFNQLCDGSTTPKYHGKLHKLILEQGFLEIPHNENYPDAAAIVLKDKIIIRHLFGHYSLWDITHIEERHRLWKIIRPQVKRLQSFTINLAEHEKIQSLKLTIYSPDGTLSRLGKRDIRIEEYRDPITHEFLPKAVIPLPDLDPNTIIELKYRIKYLYPKFWEKIYIQGPDPIISYYYGVLFPEFPRMAPTKFYAPVVHSQPLSYKFLAYDATIRKFVSEQKDKHGFHFYFKNLPALKEIPYTLPSGNISSFIAYNVYEIIVRNPLAPKYKPEYKDYMNIPAYKS
ncbi:DUF3857 domain-containing protein [candidate division CSSED10-310 bacterium]|uniref:DUF3857 domain-containing protein n=1 Tax=candidate division CSSED10-310 bacterium TaxID=2855610 RepID=A0ABV6Z180_UNCC1